MISHFNKKLCEFAYK
jgi:hypothetical protein